LVQNIFLGIMIGLVFLDLPYDQTGISRRFSSAFFVSINQGVFAVYAVITAFPAERDIILRERASGTYSTLPYFLAKSVAEVPMQILFPTIFTIIVYFMMGYRNDFYAFAHFWILVELGNMCAISLGFAISAASPTVGLATVLTPLIMEMARLFGGFFSQPVALPGGLIWIQYLSFLTYVFTGVAKNEIKPLRFFCTSTQLVNGICPITSGEQALEQFNLMDIEIYQCELVLLSMIIAYRLVAYVFVLRNK
jgi:ABC-type multidrug transport system permease subunit